MSELATALEARVECPKCLAQLTYYDTVNSTHFACPECRTLFTKNLNGTTTVIKRLDRAPDERPALAVGSIGTLPNGRLYRITGYMVRKEQGSGARWLEFMLFNPSAGYAQLAVYQGHWMFIEPSQVKLRSQGGRAGSERVVEVDYTTYNIYNKYKPRTVYAAGEFDWNILDDDKLVVTEYVAPPRMLVEEKVPGGTVHWYQAEYLEPDQIAKAFALPPAQLPDRYNVGAIQPGPGGSSWPALLKFTGLMLALAFVTQLFLLVWNTERQLLKQDFVSSTETGPPYSPEATSKVLVSPSFTVTENPSTLEVEVRTNLDNTWMELPVSLVNEQTGQGFEFTKNIEYYHGYESGESWSEGSVEADALLTGIPAGRYHLNLYPLTEYNRSASFTVTVNENPALPSNFFLFVLLLLVYPAIQMFRRSLHEQSRWEQSDYAAPSSSS